ncbi:MAG TPA: hypothetical protein VMT22_13935 [Terriglobales bacterium]|nr:hypothetical protein [Terriglobales bacterium]
MNNFSGGTQQKALAINLDPLPYGSFAEIGAGQEVARWFFHAGGAAGTVAKTISAYDMTVSNALYGSSSRYVSRQRLEAMLDHEYAQLLERLGPSRGERTSFFVFADTVAARGYQRSENGRGWVGIRFQTQPGSQPSEIIVHTHLTDLTAPRQQEALGVLGVNLIFGALRSYHEPAALLGSLADDLGRDRLEIDMIKFSGPAFAGIDNRLMSLQLVEQGLTDAAMFTAAGEVVQPSEVLYKKPILVERGSFRPPTKLTADLLESARERFLKEPGVQAAEPVVLAEMTLRNLLSGKEIDHSDFLARTEILGALRIDVLISRFQPYYQLADYLSTYTDRLIGLAVGLPSVRQMSEERFYTELPGGVLESMGRLFKRSVKMYVYPTLDPESSQIRTADTAPIPPPWHHMRDLLMEIGRLEPLRKFNRSYLSIHSTDVLERLRRGDPAWEQMVLAPVAEVIKTKELFGYPGARRPNVLSAR